MAANMKAKPRRKISAEDKSHVIALLQYRDELAKEFKKAELEVERIRKLRRFVTVAGIAEKMEMSTDTVQQICSTGNFI